MAYGTPGIQTHEQWLGLVQPVGLVVAPDPAGVSPGGPPLVLLLPVHGLG